MSMPTRLNKLLKVSRSDLRSKGVYNALIDFDSRLHIDPALIESTGIKEFKGSKQKVVKYFTNILRLVKASKRENDLFWKQAFAKLCFGEGLNTGLGYSARGTGGSGIGPKTANIILNTIKEIQNAGINDPDVFELVGIFEENVGPDRISDMISIILKDDFRDYTSRIASELKVKTKQYRIEEITYNLPVNFKTQEPLIFVPEKMLNDLPVADDWEDVPLAAEYSEKIKGSLNRMLLDSWKDLGKINKAKLKDLLLNNPELIKELLVLYKKRPKKGYDFGLDHLGELVWDVLGENYSKEYPVDLTAYNAVTEQNIFEIVTTICMHFKKLMEENGLVEHIYDSNGAKRPERFPQLLLFSIADSYCNANDLDLSREPNAGSGALDFKISRGLKKVNVEVKYSSNPKLVEGFEKQLPTYNRAESVKTKNSIYLIIRVNDKNDYKINRIKEIIKERESKKLQSPTLIIINGIKQPSASKRE